MLIKEYRIAMPMSVDEYRIAQLYMIQKKSREESEGKESGVEILINEPYTDGPGGSGQYTRKIYHIGSHLPGWFQAILPKSALLVEEEAWNAYPYTRTIFRCPFIQKFMLEIETYYYNDGGDQENVFNLSAAEQRNRVVDHLDIVRDTISTGDYKNEEDPELFKSKKTGRGPLEENWLKTYMEAARSADSNTAIMCAYKLCKVEFRYWGMQNKIERFIHDVGLRKTMLRAHRQAWCWQDEYHGLTMADIRRLERETQLALQEKMNEDTDREAASVQDIMETATEPTENTTSAALSEMVATTVMTERHLPVSVGSPVVVRRVCSRLSGVTSSHRKESWASVRSGFSRPGSNLALSDWQQMDSLEQLRTPSSDDEEEFFDAHDELHADVVNQTALLKSSSIEILVTEETDSVDSPSGGETVTPLDRRMEQYLQSVSHGGETGVHPTPLTQANPPSCHTTVLFLVLHGGSILDSGFDQLPKTSDIATLKSTFDAVIQAHYPAISGHIAIRLVACPAICSNTLNLLNSLSPAGYNEVCDNSCSDGPATFKQNFLLNTIPLFATGSPEYTDAVKQVTTRANDVFSEFSRTEEGLGFTGQVCLIADSIGSVIGYDALCKHFVATHGCVKFNASDSEMSPTDLECNSSRGGVSWRTNLETIKQMSFSNPDMSGALVQEEQTVNKDNITMTKAKNSGTGHDNCSPWKRQTSCPNSRRTSTASQSGPSRFNFDVSDFFMFGAPLGLVLAYRKSCGYDCTNAALPKPHCLQMYNLFYASDPAGVRLEPLLCGNFRHLSPMSVPRYQKFPLGDGQAVHVVEVIQANLSRFIDLAPPSLPSPSPSPEEPDLERRQSNMSMLSQVSGRIDFAVASITKVTSQWWGTKRLDYVLYCPDALQSFPHTALPYLLHASFWESTDVVAFILRQVVRQEYVTMQPESQKEASLFSPGRPREKWLKRRTTMKLRNVAPNHRANDLVVLEGRPQSLVARFMYGPLDIVSLSGEKVDVHIMTVPPQGEWQFFGTVVTESNGKATFEIPKDKVLGLGMYPVKMVVRGDHTSVDFYVAVLQPKTEVVVFSIDGSFTASVSIMGKDPKVRPGAVDVVRHWQDLGYLIVYVTARPDMQQKKVVTWLAQHNFPHGMVSFIDGLSADPLRQKTNYLKQLKNEAQIEIHAAYGSSKDISVYQSVGLQSTQIYIVGKVSKKHHKDAVVISDGYAAHLACLASDSASRPATGNTRMMLHKSCFSLPGQSQGCGRKRQVKKTSSLPPSAVSHSELLHKCQETGSVSIGVTEEGNTVVETTGSLKGSLKKRWSGRNMSPRGGLE